MDAECDVPYHRSMTYMLLSCAWFNTVERRTVDCRRASWRNSVVINETGRLRDENKREREREKKKKISLIHADYTCVVIEDLLLFLVDARVDLNKKETPSSLSPGTARKVSLWFHIRIIRCRRKTSFCVRISRTLGHHLHGSLLKEFCSTFSEYNRLDCFISTEATHLYYIICKNSTNALRND